MKPRRGETTYHLVYASGSYCQSIDVTSMLPNRHVFGCATCTVSHTIMPTVFICSFLSNLLNRPADWCTVLQQGTRVFQQAGNLLRPFIVTLHSLFISTLVQPFTIEELVNSPCGTVPISSSFWRLCEYFAVYRDIECCNIGVGQQLFWNANLLLQGASHYHSIERNTLPSSSICTQTLHQL